MIRAIIFDCYGVLAYSGWIPFKRRYLTSDPHKARQATELRAQVDSGVLSYADFLTHISTLSGLASDEAQRLIEDNPVNQQLLTYIAHDLKPQYKIGFLSNAATDRLHELFSLDQAALFDAAVLSYQVGLIKPDPRIYRLTAEKLQAQPGECLLIDDQLPYCDGARAAGMQAIHYQNFEQARHEIEQLLQTSSQSEK